MVKEVLRLERLSKSFGSVKALKNASLILNEGQVVALLGDNGAGKSTLIKLVSGVYTPDGGEIVVEGRKASIRSTRDAIDLGIETIHQDTSLAPDLSIARNLFLGREPTRLSFLGLFAPMDRESVRASASLLLSKVGITKKLGADAPVSTLSGGERQAIAIARAMRFAAKVIILDEPTNNLGVEETHGVLRFIREVKAAGHSVIFITHNIHHVFEVADRIVVMRRGEVVAEMAVKDTDLYAVESAITGADIHALRSDGRGEGRQAS
jgi:simple sugar transport system ATP-binding protein